MEGKKVRKRLNQSTDLDESIVGEKIQRTDKETALPNNYAEWSIGDISKLIDNVTILLPVNDPLVYKTRLKKLDWNELIVPPYTAEECKGKVLSIIKKQQYYQTLANVMENAKKWVKGPWKPDKRQLASKKPKTTFMIFCDEKRPVYKKKYPNMSFLDMGKYLGKKYNKLSEDKKQKYKDMYQTEMVKYRLVNPKTRPACVRKEVRAKIPRPKKPPTALQLFLSSKKEKNPSILTRDLDAYKKKWKALTEKKKLKWLKKEMAEIEQYNEKVKAYNLKRRKSKMVEIVDGIEKLKKKMTDKPDKKQKRPLKSPYQFFCRIHLKEMTDVPVTERMTVISKLWRELSEEEKDVYRNMVSEGLKKYDKECRELEENHLSECEEEWEDAQEEVQECREVVPKNKEKDTALLFYTQKQNTVLKTQHPDKSPEKLAKIAKKMFKKLPPAEKEKYEKLADEANRADKISTHSKESDSGSSTVAASSPRSGYMLFAREALDDMDDVKPKKRITKIDKQWEALSATDRKKYEKKAKEMTNKDAKKSLANLSQESRVLYNEIMKMRQVSENNDKVGGNDISTKSREALLGSESDAESGTGKTNTETVTPSSSEASDGEDDAESGESETMSSSDE